MPAHSRLDTTSAWDPGTRLRRPVDATIDTPVVGWGAGAAVECVTDVVDLPMEAVG